MMNNNPKNDYVSEEEIKKFYELTVYGRWILVVISWILILPWALWELRETIGYCQEYCTWSAVRLGLEFHPWATLGLSFCIAFVTSVLVWQSTYILRGKFSDKEKYYLIEKVKKIRAKNKNNWLYKLMYY